jgi:hypothetical protein
MLLSFCGFVLHFWLCTKRTTDVKIPGNVTPVTDPLNAACACEYILFLSDAIVGYARPTLICLGDEAVSGRSSNTAVEHGSQARQATAIGVLDCKTR